MKTGIFAAALALTATSALAAPADDEGAEAAATAAPGQQAPAADTDSDAAPAEEKKICRTERATGSLTRRTRVCLTQAQWREIHDRTRRGVGEMQGTAAGSQAIPNNPGG